MIFSTQRVFCGFLLAMRGYTSPSKIIKSPIPNRWLYVLFSYGQLALTFYPNPTKSIYPNNTKSNITILVIIVKDYDGVGRYLVTPL